MSGMDVLAIHPGALGDCILFGRLLDTIDARVRFVGPGEVGRLLVGLGAVEEAVDFNALPMHELFTDGPLSEPLCDRLGRCERLIACFPADNPAAQQRLIEACGAKRATFLPIRLPADESRHLLDSWFARLGESVAAADVAKTRWPVPATWQHKARELLAVRGVSEEFALLHPGAGGQEKRWPLEHYLEVARQLRASLDVVWIRGPAECQSGDESVLRGQVVVDSPSLEVLAGLQCLAKGYLGNDSGPSHLAAALGAKTIAIFCITSPKQFAPLGPDAKFLQVFQDQSFSRDRILKVFTYELGIT